MATYDRMTPYLRCLRSIKPAIYRGSDIDLAIRVDTKLSKPKYYLKKFLTKLVLGSSQYTFDWGRECIGKSRNLMISQCDSEFFMNFDDDDLLNANNLLKVCSESISEFDIINFDYYASESVTELSMSECTKGNWIPKYWFNNSDLGVAVGQSSIFKRSIYPSNKKYQYHRSYVDDMLPNHVMYLEADKIGIINLQIVKRCRGENSLMNTSNFEKFTEIVESLDEFYEYLTNKCAWDIAYSIWKKALSNQLEYHRRKSGETYFKLLHRCFRNQELWQRIDQ